MDFSPVLPAILISNALDIIDVFVFPEIPEKRFGGAHGVSEYDGVPIGLGLSGCASCVRANPPPKPNRARWPQKRQYIGSDDNYSLKKFTLISTSFLSFEIINGCLAVIVSNRYEKQNSLGRGSCSQY